jgi:hypothetical protein
MSETFDIVDPVEKFVEAREAVAPSTETAGQGRQTKYYGSNRPRVRGAVIMRFVRRFLR